MKTYKFGHQLGIATIKVFPDGSAKFNNKTYKSYTSARRALTHYYGFAWFINKHYVHNRSNH